MSALKETIYESLQQFISRQPIIDHHAHPFLKERNRSALPFEGVVSEAENTALTRDAVHTLASIRGAKQLCQLLELPLDSSWSDIKAARSALNYDDLCRMSMGPTNIHCILIDDGLGAGGHLGEPVAWHDQFTSSPCKRVARIETLAEELIEQMLLPHVKSKFCPPQIGRDVEDALSKLLRAVGSSNDVVAFKSIVCYRTGLQVSTSESTGLDESFENLFRSFQENSRVRLQHKPINDLVVRTALGVAGVINIPVQFHTGLGDSDMSLALATPSLLQPIIKAFPNTKFVLLHASYPYVREAAYLTAVHENVYLDFGEVFPIVSRTGQMTLLTQILELCPTNKLMWSTDGHWWPESFYLATVQIRETLCSVLSELVENGDLTLPKAQSFTRKVLFDNADKLYELGFAPAL